jgi:precorrin-6B methylase 2
LWQRSQIVVDLDVAYVPTPKDIVRQMLQLASLRRGETLFDLGAGDGRIMIDAVRRFGAKAVGVEIDPERISRTRERLAATVTQAELIEGDLFQVDLSSADVIAIYLSDSANAKLAAKLKDELKAGARVVSLDYKLPGWAADRELEVNTSGITRRLYLYKIT